MSINFKLVFVVSVSISVSLSADSSAVDSANSTELDGNATTDYECRCLNTNLEILGFQSKFVRGNLVLSWNASEEVDDDCKIKYDVRHESSDTPFGFYFRSMIDNTHVINGKNLERCRSYKFTIKAYRSDTSCNLNENEIYPVVYTEPENITSLDVDIGDEVTIVEWSPTAYCSKYRLFVDGKAYNYSVNRAEFPGSLDCANISVQTLAVDYKTSPLLTKTVPGKVLNLILSVFQKDLVISWDPPKNHECVTNYEIVVNGQTLTQNETSITILDFEGCISYEGSVAALSSNGKGDAVTFKQLVNPEIMNDVNNLKFDETSRTLVWERPSSQGKCTILYVIKLENYNDAEETFETYNTSYVFPKIGKCMEYSMGVRSTTKYALDSDTITLNISTEKIVPYPPVCKVDAIGKTTATIFCSTEDYYTNACTLVLIEITCTPEEGSRTSRIARNNVTISDDGERTGLVLDIYNLTAFTNYSCTSKLYNTEGPSEDSHAFRIETDEDVPSEPLNFRVSHTQATSFNLDWDEPNDLPGVFDVYELTIIPNGSKHFIPDGCPSGEPVRFTVHTKKNSYFYEAALPNYEYLLSVRAKTIDFGEKAFADVTTEDGVPEEPREPESDIKNILGIDYRVSVEFNWLYPCQTNGIVKYFLLQLYKTPNDQNGTFAENPKVYEVEPNKEISNIDYAFEIDGIEPLHSYKATLQTVLEYNAGSTEWSIEFDAPPGLPSAPILTEIIQDSSGTILVNWEEPINKTGKLTKYNLNITSLRPLHPVPEGCKTYTGLTPLYLDSKENFYEFTNSHPNYEYDITLSASTEAGYGQIVNKQFNSNKSAPEVVRNLDCKVLYNKDVPEYDVELTVIFDTPCNLNGELINYEVTLKGIRNGKEHTEYGKGLDLEYIFKLKAETDYSFSVESITDSGLKGISVGKILEKTEAGVPVVFDAKPSVTSTQTSASFILNKDFFGENNGQILYYAVLLVNAEAYDHDAKTFGYWNGDNWPDSGNWSDGGIIKKIQTTPNRWNPFNKYSSNTTIEFILGNGESNCSEEFCNAPLSGNTSYALEIRAYTNGGYRNTDVIFFDTIPHDMDKAMTVIEILGIVVGVLAVVILSSGGGFYYWRRKMQPQPMAPQHFEEDLHLPIPISIAAFPEYYAEIKAKPEILKMDFQAMNATSLDEALPITIATLPENRKKNRYTNILPFDATRVILNSSSSDYINASYIKGFADTVEYIATQGPMASTAHDFWRMIIEEDVNVIVMLAQFVEQKREKCYKYFPDKNEQMEIEDIQIRCSIELDYDYFCERHFLVQTDGRKYNIVHLQFMNWPDFGCPEGTDNMLSFCLIVRKFIEEFSCKAVMHCSAGVGRTGTLIAIDILLQIIRCDGDIHVHNTVLNLRKQRKNMVQTEAQYLYIHSCINDAILKPRVLEIRADEEPIYENAKGMELKIFKSDDNENIEME